MEGRVAFYSGRLVRVFLLSRLWAEAADSRARFRLNLGAVREWAMACNSI